MSRVITFSRRFPASHIRVGEPTFFVEKIFKSFGVKALGETFYAPITEDIFGLNQHLPSRLVYDFITSLEHYWIPSNDFNPKIHTIRRGKRWKAGDRFSPRVWTDAPYRSKQLIIAPDIQLKRVADFEMSWMDNIFIDRKPLRNLTTLAENDGLSHGDLLAWLRPYAEPKTFSGQILIWSDQELPY